MFMYYVNQHVRAAINIEHLQKPCFSRKFEEFADTHNIEAQSSEPT